MHEFESFETAKFVGRLLGRGDWGSFIDKVKDVIPEVSLPAGAELAGRAGSAQAGQRGDVLDTGGRQVLRGGTDGTGSM